MYFELIIIVTNNNTAENRKVGLTNTLFFNRRVGLTNIIYISAFHLKRLERTLDEAN